MFLHDFIHLRHHRSRPYKVGERGGREREGGRGEGSERERGVVKEGRYRVTKLQQDISSSKRCTKFKTSVAASGAQSLRQQLTQDVYLGYHGIHYK